jgi:nicotinate dehydrogenase subunit B
VLLEEVAFDARAVQSREWGAYPILTFAQVPSIDVVPMHRPRDPPLGAGESASVPSAAAIANAIFDATGVRFREPPFTPERIRAGLGAAALPAPDVPSSAWRPEPPSTSWWRRRRGFVGTLGAAAAGALGMAAVLLPRGSIPPIPRPDAAVYTAATIAHGRQVAAIGGCLNCHSGPAGSLAGGLALDTAFGRIWSTNITPDPATGIGAWSFAAFERAMRDGISRDGHHLYPAHPYTAFTRTSEADLQALYAYVMAQPAVANAVPKTDLRFPFNLRPLLAAWNALFLRKGRSSRTRPARPSGTGAPTWSKGLVIAAAATRPETRSARSAEARPISPAP